MTRPTDRDVLTMTNELMEWAQHIAEDRLLDESAESLVVVAVAVGSALAWACGVEENPSPFQDFVRFMREQKARESSRANEEVH